MKSIRNVFNINILKKCWSSLTQSLLHLVYPGRCLHCETLLPPESYVLCKSCSTLLDPIDPDLRCPACFNLLDEDSPYLCESCVQDPSSFYRIGAVFDYEGPAASLVKRLKYGNQPYLASGMGAFYVAQFDRLGWPLPDALIPVPLSSLHWFERGYNQSELIAVEIGKLLERPVWDILKRRSGDYSQAALPFEQRNFLERTSFKLKSGPSVENKTVLLIDDVMTSGTTLQRCAEVLLDAKSGPIYGMTFCRTLLKND